MLVTDTDTIHLERLHQCQETKVQHSVGIIYAETNAFVRTIIQNHLTAGNHIVIVLRHRSSSDDDVAFTFCYDVGVVNLVTQVAV